MAVTIRSVTISDSTSTYSMFNQYIQRRSKLRISVNATSNAGTIRTNDYSITVNGSTYRSNNITTDVLKNSGTNTITIYVYDNMGGRASTTRTVSVTAYNTPVISAYNVIRCNSNGTANKAGAYAKATIVATCTNLTGGSYYYHLSYKKTSEQLYDLYTFSSTSATINESVILPNIDVNSSYEFKFEAQDYYVNTYKLKQLSTKFTIFNVLSNALGVAFGKKAEYENGFEIGFEKTYLGRTLYMGGDKTNNTQKQIYFNSPDTSTYPSECYLYGGSGDSVVAIGCYDTVNEIRPWAYNSITKRLYSEAEIFEWNGKRILTTDDYADSNWQTLTLTSYWEAYDSNSTPRYRKIGKVVELKGAIKATTAGTGTNAVIVIGTLPSGYRPQNYSVCVLCQGGNYSQWCLSIATNGEVRFSRFATGATYGDYSTSTWLPFQATFTVA